MRIVGLSCAAAICLFSLPVLAEATFDGVFISDVAGCQELEKKGLAAVFARDIQVLTLEEGVQAFEYHCDFLDAKGSKAGDIMVVTAFCEYPGAPFPDLLSLLERGENSISVTSLHDKFENAASARSYEPSVYHRCENLKELPR